MSQRLFTPNRQTRFVLEFVLNAGYCNSNSSVRPLWTVGLGAYTTWPRPEGTPGLQATLLMLVLHLLVQCSCKILGNHVVLQKTRSDRQWHHGVSSVRGTRQRFSCGVVQQKYAEWIRGRLSRRVVHAYAFFFTLPELHPFCLALAGSISRRSCGDHKIICGAVIYANNVRFQPRAVAEQTSALMNCARKDFSRSDIADNWLVTRHFCFKYVQKCAHADSGKSLSGARREKGECTPSGYVTSVPSRNISPLPVGRRCICRLQDVHCAALAFSGLEWETFACLPHVLCTKALRT